MTIAIPINIIKYKITPLPDCQQYLVLLSCPACYLPGDDNLAALPEVEDGTVQHPGAPDKLETPQEERDQVGGQPRQLPRAGGRGGLHHRDDGVDQHLAQEEGGEHEGNIKERDVLLALLVM